VQVDPRFRTNVTDQHLSESSFLLITSVETTALLSSLYGLQFSWSCHHVTWSC